MTTSESSSAIERHPDIVALRERYDRIGETVPAQLAAGALFLAAGYAAMSPWVVGFRPTSPNLAVTDLITGVAVMVLTVGFGASYGRTHGMAWMAPLVGVWLIVAPWAVQDTDRTTGLLWSNIVAGACVVLFGLVLTALAAPMRSMAMSAGGRRRMSR